MRIHKIPPLLIITLLSLMLGGCLKARLVINVEADGSGTFGMAMGMTKQLQALANSQGTDPMQRLGQELSAENPQDSNLRRWTEGEYEWMEQTKPFKSLEELNQLASEVELFESFSLTRQRGLFKDRFVLDAQLKSLADEEEIPEDAPFDPSSMFEFQLSTHLPGDITETNGVYEANSNSVLWTIGGTNSATIHAVSEVWNWFNIGIAAVIIGGIGIGLIGSAAAFVYVKSRKGKVKLGPATTPAKPALQRLGSVPIKEKTSPAVSPETFPHLLTEIDARKYLQQVNHQILKGKGVITETPGKIKLAWSDDEQAPANHKILIRVVDAETITINGDPFRASEDGVKRGLVACLRKMNLF